MIKTKCFSCCSEQLCLKVDVKFFCKAVLDLRNGTKTLCVANDSLINMDFCLLQRRSATFWPCGFPESIPMLMKLLSDEVPLSQGQLMSLFKNVNVGIQREGKKIQLIHR